jgi:hypothetical protein
MKGFYMDERASALTRLLRQGTRYMISITISDENSAKTALVYSLQVYFSCNQSNWE